MQGGECAAVRALQARVNAAARRLLQPKTHLFLSEYLVAGILAELALQLLLEDLAVLRVYMKHPADDEERED